MVKPLYSTGSLSLGATGPEPPNRDFQNDMGCLAPRRPRVWPGFRPGSSRRALLLRQGGAAEYAVLEEHPERRPALVLAVERAPLALMAKRAALRRDRGELDHGRIDRAALGGRRDRQEGGDALVADDHRVVALDHP